MLRFVLTALALPLIASFLLTESLKRWPGLKDSLGFLPVMTGSSQQTTLHVAPHEILQPAFLWVAAETGEQCTDEEFNGGRFL